MKKTLSLKNPPKIAGLQALKAPKKPEAKPIDRTAEMQACLKKLIAAYPKAFDYKNIRPLKTGIIRDLRADFKEKHGVTHAALSSAIRYYTLFGPYLQAVVDGDKRIDLNGEEVEAIEASQKEYSLELLKTRAAKKKPENVRHTESS